MIDESNNRTNSTSIKLSRQNVRVMGLHTQSNNLYIDVWFEEVGNVNNTTVNKDLLQHVLYFLWHIEKVVQL
jgi:hypothetical protein